MRRKHVPLSHQHHPHKLNLNTPTSNNPTKSVLRKDRKTTITKTIMTSSKSAWRNKYGNLPLPLFHRLLFLVFFIKGLNCMYDEEGPSFTDEPPSKVEFINEAGIRVNCSAKGRPTPLIQWTLADMGPILEVPGLRYISSDGSLVFAAFPAESFRPDVHSATYRCIASNSVGTIVTRDVQVRAVVKQSFETQVPSEAALRGASVILECLILPNYIRDYVIVTSWVRDKSFNILPTSVESDNKYYMMPDGRLLIWQVTPQDIYSSYQCRTLHRLTGQTSVSSPGKIIINEGEGSSRPTLQHRVGTVVAKENDVVVLPCIAHAHPKISYKWFKKEGSRLTPVIDDSVDEMRQNGRIDASGAGVKIRHGALIIHSVRVANKGLYLCNASNAEGSDTLEVELTIRSPLTVNLQPDKVTVDLGKNADFSCIASGEPQPVSISWLKDGVTLRAGSTAGRVRFIGQSRIQVVGVVREDQGIYQCIGKNDYETAQESTQLWLGDAYPQFIYRFIEQTLQPGPAISLKCSATGNPTPQVSWLLDGFPLPQSDRFLMGQYANVYGDVISHVNITSVRVEDGGEYECSFENRAGRTSHTARLNIYGQPYVRPMPDILATSGQRLTIKCPVGGYPVEIIVWERDGLKLPMSDRQSVSSNGTLSVEPVERPDAGTYTCLAESKQGLTSQRSVNVRVMVPPKITPFSFATDLHVGERASIQCVVVKGDIPLTITWLKDTVPLNSHSQNNNHHQQLQHINNNNNNNNINPNPNNNINTLIHGLKMSIRHMDHFTSSLSIPSLESGHSGNYTCQARNNAATATYTSQLLVNVPPRISPFLFDSGLMEGMRTQVICSTTDGDEPIKYTWAKDETDVVVTATVVEGVGSGVHVSYLPPFSTILTIPNITASHSGNYSCKVANKAGHTVHTAQLVVSVPSKWVVEPADESVSVGTHVAIHCQAQGFPKPIIKWKQAVVNGEKKDFREIGYRTPGVLSAENGTLIISRVTEDHEGYYLCQGANGVGAGISKLIRLTVNAAPRIKARPPKEMVRRGETARLRCEAEGDEPIRISWLAKGISLNESSDSRFSIGSSSTGPVSELTIREVTTSDRGDYECLAVNAFGQDSTRISVLVQEKPQVPRNFRIVEHTSRSVVLTWSLPTLEQDASVLDYILWYKEETDSWNEQTNKKSTSGDQTSIIVTSLSPATSYQFKLYARNQLGTSDHTEVLQVMTDSEPPGGPPTHVTVEAISSEELRISWQPPPREYQHGQILGYNIGLKKSRDELSSFNWSRIDHTGSSGVVSTNMHNLEKYTEYEVVIQAYNRQGQGPTSELVLGATMEDVPSAPPLEVKCSALTAHSLTITWQPPPKKHIHGIILAYRVVYEFSSDPDSTETDYSSGGAGSGSHSELESRVTTLTTVLHGLTPYTNFSVQVAAGTSVGDGVFSTPLYCRTLESVPEAPAAIKASVSSLESVIVSWQRPKKPNGRIDKYHVYIRFADHGTGRELRTVKRTLPAGSWTYEVNDLKRRETCEAWVSAETHVGEGQKSPSVPFSAPASVPAALVSFGEIVTVPWKTDVNLPCVFVGLPKPILTWKKREVTISESSSSRLEIQYKDKDSPLLIKNVQRSDSGNYSCLVKNPRGSDHIIYMLQVQVPPTAPLLHQTQVSSSSVRLQWKQGDNGGSVVLGYFLSFRTSPDGDWEELGLSRKLSTYQVEGLKCGTPYEFYLTGYNKIGTGTASDIVSVTTRGGRPQMPAASHFLQSNSTSITLNLSAWNSSECPITSFVVEYKVRGGGSNWILVKYDGGMVDNKMVQINELTPETDYIVRVRASNSAGSSATEYEISTSLFKGGLTSSNFNGGSSSSSSSSSQGGVGGGIQGDSAQRMPFYQDIHIILPILVSLAAIIAGMCSVFLCWRKKGHTNGMMESTTSLAFRRDNGRSGGDTMTDRDYTVIRAKYISAECDHIPESAEDIYPYATFHLPEKECLTENIPEGFLHAPSSQRLSNAETIPIRQIPRGGTIHNHGGGKQRRKSRGSTNSNSNRTGTGGGGSGGKSGESEEYDDSYGSDSDGMERDLEGEMMKSTGRRGGPIFLNDETLLVTDRDRKSLPRPLRPKFMYGGNTGVPGGNQRLLNSGYAVPVPVSVGLGLGRRSIPDETTTSFMYAPTNQSGAVLNGPEQYTLTHHPLELNQMDCDNMSRIHGRNNVNVDHHRRYPLNGGGGVVVGTGNPVTASAKISSKPNILAKGFDGHTQHPHNHPHGDYTIAV